MEKAAAERRERFLEKFMACRKALSAVGDETRQLIICAFIEHCGGKGMRVGELQKLTNLSRTAISHHLAVLKEAELISVRKEGTKNYYYLDGGSPGMRHIVAFWKEAEQMVAYCPGYQYEQKRKKEEI